MATATERVPVLMTPDEKNRVVSKAKKFGITIGEYMRRAADGYRPAEDDEALEAMIHEMNKATDNAERAIDDAMDFVKASNQRIKIMESDTKSGVV